MLEKIKTAIRNVMESFLTFLLLGTQTVFLYGVTISTMLTPLLAYLPILLRFAAAGDERFSIYVLTAVPFYYGVVVGQVVSIVGLAIFFVAASQWIWLHHKKAGLFTKGLYSKVRHPQFLGIIVITLGLTIKVLESGINGYVLPRMPSMTFGWQPLLAMWFLQVLGYITIAWYEERQLSKKFSEYKNYKQKVSFMFPIKTPKKIPEIPFTVLLVAVICLVILLLPYQQIDDLLRNLPHIVPYK
jgi:protein-S-isoprenylcysteine O-methyltransferase Ste14